MKSKRIQLQSEALPSFPEIKLRPARIEDARRIQMLYAEVYGQHYTIPTVYDRGLMCRAIESDSYFWLVGEHKGRIIASLVYSIDRLHRTGKALGAVVSKEYRKHNLASMMMKIILDKITRENDLVDVIYATTRTVTTAPQQMADTQGFIPLGIFPNSHKIFDYETHCLAAYFVKKSWDLRREPAVLLPEIKPFFDMVNKELQKVGLKMKKPELARPDHGSLSGMNKTPKHQALLDFEAVSAPVFVKNRARTLGNSGVFANTFVPFHEPNLMLVSHDQKNEIYVHCEPKDRY
ncbi:MAG: GNAT family N-acetyltransferase, partial [Elusimicrobia bacterium]|nr:GNAT family N-acetyltransferase [Elusimicrobiota bacterium]